MSGDPKTCHQCQHRRPGWCTNARQAQLSQQQRAEVGSDLARMHQNCNGFKEKKQ